MKYIKHGFAITVQLPKSNYEIMALIKKTEVTENTISYDVDFLLNRNTIGKWDEIDNITFVKTKEQTDINMEVYNYIMELNSNGHFNYFIDRYEYELNMAEIGINLDEKERLGIK